MEKMINSIMIFKGDRDIKNIILKMNMLMLKLKEDQNLILKVTVKKIKIDLEIYIISSGKMLIKEKQILEETILRNKCLMNLMSSFNSMIMELTKMILRVQI